MIPFSVLTVFKATFEAVDRPWLGAGFAFLAVVINVPLNYALIWGLGPLPHAGADRGGHRLAGGRGAGAGGGLDLLATGDGRCGGCGCGATSVG
jgi:Na+-driven multidrug efflux pump